MKPLLSLIIPYHNSEQTIGRLLESIAKSKYAPPHEVIVVDDGSRTKFQPSRSKSHKSKVHGRKSTGHILPKTIRTIRLASNIGPAIARNRGARIARGKFLVFLDSDVELFPDTLRNLAKIYLDDPDIVALTGVWVKEQRSHDFFPNYKALRDWSYWINERDKSGYYYLFSTRIASIKKSVFKRLGGFDETYAAPLVEDIELTYRIARRYAVIFAPNVRVRHEFESFGPIAKKYFWRAYYWTKLYQKRKKFDPVATTWFEALTSITGLGTVALGALMVFVAALSFWVSQLFGGEANIAIINSIVASAFALMLLVHILFIRTFLLFVYKEKGLLFAIKSFFIGLVLYTIIFSGALWGRVK